MKKVLIALIVFALVGGMAWSQEESQPRSSVSFVLGGSLVAPIGVGFEFFVGTVGIAGEVRGLFLAVEGDAIGTLEPGVYLRFYFSDLDSSFYLFGGSSYLTVWDSQAGVVDAGILKPKAGVGYNALFGKDNRTRFNVELGGVWFKPVEQGEIIDMGSLLLPHFLIGFGRTF